MTEADILQKLFAWHKEHGELFFSHVKTGSSWLSGQQLRILDGLAVKISWTKPSFMGYEIKVSRGDFLRDKKHTEYLPYCTTFYFVCPDKMIRKDEVEGDIGLIYCREDGSLRTVKRAVSVEPDVNALNSLLRYLVYYRSGSNRQQIMDAAKQVVREKRKTAESEHKAREFQDRLYSMQNEYYAIPREIRKQYRHAD
jgi:hypothetical protein